MSVRLQGSPPPVLDEPQHITQPTAPIHDEPVVSSSLQTLFSTVIGPQLDAAKACVQKLHSFVTKEASSLVTNYKKTDVEGTLITELALKNAPTKEAYLQILTQLAVYETYPDGQLLPPSELFIGPQYQVKKTIEYPEGIKIMVLAANDLNEAPLMVVRGTDPRNIRNIQDNFHKNIGSLNTKKYKKELENELETVAIAHGRIHIMGHSYGGAIAQQLTARHIDLISRCTRYNAPGVGDKVVNAFTANLKSLPKGYEKPEIVSYRHAKDLISLLGGASLPTDPDRDYTAGSVDDTISHIDAHSCNTLSAGLAHRSSTESHDHYNNVSTFLEKCRNKVAAHVSSK